MGIEASLVFQESIRMKFSIRDLLWLMALAAVLTAWWVDRGRLGQVIETQNREFMRLHEEADRAAAEVQAAINSLPNSSAPAPNPPKD